MFNFRFLSLILGCILVSSAANIYAETSDQLNRKAEDLLELYNKAVYKHKDLMKLKARIQSEINDLDREYKKYMELYEINRQSSVHQHLAEANYKIATQLLHSSVEKERRINQIIDEAKQVSFEAMKLKARRESLLEEFNRVKREEINARNRARAAEDEKNGNSKDPNVDWAEEKRRFEEMEKLKKAETPSSSRELVEDDRLAKIISLINSVGIIDWSLGNSEELLMEMKSHAHLESIEGKLVLRAQLFQKNIKSGVVTLEYLNDSSYTFKLENIYAVDWTYSEGDNYAFVKISIKGKNIQLKKNRFSDRKFDLDGKQKSFEKIDSPTLEQIPENSNTVIRIPLKNVESARDLVEKLRSLISK